jgi:hypothetical protein
MVKWFRLLTTCLNSLGAYIGWLVNELMMTANKKKYKDTHLVMLLVDALNP